MVFFQRPNDIKPYNLPIYCKKLFKVKLTQRHLIDVCIYSFTTRKDLPEKKRKEN